MEKNLNNNKAQNENKIITIDEIPNKNEFNFSFENEKQNTLNFISNFVDEKEIENEIDKNLEEDSKEENCIFKSILDDLNKNIEINIKENNNKDFQEILDILKYPHSDKNIRDRISPFKPLLRPKKISMIGKVLSDFPEDENNNTTGNTTLNDNNSRKMKF